MLRTFASTYFFYSSRIRTLVAMATYIFHRLIMGKVKKAFFLSQFGYLEFIFLQKCLLSSPLSVTWLLSKSLNLIGCQGDKNGKFLKKKKRLSSQKS